METDRHPAIALVKRACPICGTLEDAEIIMAKSLVKNHSKVEDLHGKCVGFLDHACTHCAEHKDEVVYAVSIDIQKSEPNNPWRTGTIVGIRRDAPFVSAYEKFIITLKDGAKLVYIDHEAGKQLGIWD